MENNENPTSRNSLNKFILPGVVIVLITFAVIAVYLNQPRSVSPSSMMKDAQTSMPMSPHMSGNYKSGMYQATGSYITPGGEKEVNVSLTLDGDTISNATFKGLADDPTSQRFQEEFAANFKPLVVGKNIDDVKLTKVSGSSLTPMGFMDALSKIKSEAKS